MAEGDLDNRGGGVSTVAVASRRYRRRQFPASAPLRLATPRGAGKAEDRRRQTERLFLDPPFPLYGLPGDWEGGRSLGGVGGAQRLRHFGPFGMFNRLGPIEVQTMALRHVAPDGAELRVASQRSDGGDPPLREQLEAELCWHLGLDESPRPSPENMGAASDVWSERLVREEFGWQAVRIPVNEVPVEFSALSAANRWVAKTQTRETALVLKAHRFAIERVKLVQLTDLSAYGVNGSV